MDEYSNAEKQITKQVFETLNTCSRGDVENAAALQQKNTKKQSLWDVLEGDISGGYKAGKDFVEGIVDLVTNPVDTIENTFNAIMHPIDTFNYISKAISDSYERDVINGDANSRAEWFSYAITTLGLSVIGTKGLGSVSKTGMASTKVATKTTVNQVTGAIKKVPSINLLPYTPRNKFAYANLGAPYNVIDGTSLKDKLLSMVKKENKWSKEEIASSIPPYKPSISLKNYSVEDFTKEMANLPHARIPTEIKNEIIEIPKGQKPEPNMYMSSTEIEVHLSLMGRYEYKVKNPLKKL